MDSDRALQIRLERDIDAPNLIQSQSAVIKSGPQAWKTAQIADYGIKETGEIRSTSLILKSFARKKTGSGYAFDDKPQRWSCDGSEIAALREFLLAKLVAPGEYRLVRDDSVAGVVSRLAEDAASAAQVVGELLSMPDVRDALAATGGLEAGSALVQRKQRLAVIDQLESAALDSSTSEQTLQGLLDRQWWLFGARYIEQQTRRRFTALDEFDLPLRRSDGSLHVVELKRAQIPKLIVPYRSHHIVGPEVHAAVGQAMNYLQALDESAHVLSHGLGIDVRRVDATVVIGHSAHLSPEIQRVMAATLRTYNSHLARVQVVTYDELIDGARSALEPVRLDTDIDATASSEVGWATPAEMNPWETERAIDPWDESTPF